jgi:single-strand DNA-binding protein
MEKSINKVELSGFVGKDPQVLTLKNGKQMARFSLATSNNYKNSQQEWVRDTTWHNIVVWDKVAAEAADKIKKGCFIRLNGKIVNSQFTNKGGSKQSMVEIYAFEFEIIAVSKKETEIKAA